jgi:hypothetical protein
VPCIASLSDGVSCTAIDPFVVTAQLNGAPGASYQVTLRVRGVSELKTYSGGTTSGYWNAGGTPSTGPQNIFKLEITDPPQRFFLNAGSSNSTSYCLPLDYTQVVTVKAGAFLNLSTSVIDGAILKNRDSFGNPMVIPNVPPAPAAFAGQFIQVDPVGIQ